MELHYKIKEKLKYTDNLFELVGEPFSKKDKVIADIYIVEFWSSGYLVNSWNNNFLLLNEHRQIIGIQCTTCSAIFETYDFYSHEGRGLGVEKTCKKCRDRCRMNWRANNIYLISNDSLYLKDMLASARICPITNSTNVHLDHIMPRSINPKGGNTVGNLMWLHSKLNISKSNKNIFEWLDNMTQEKLDLLLMKDGINLELKEFKLKYNNILTIKAIEKKRKFTRI